MYYFGEEVNVGGIFISWFLYILWIIGIFCDKLIYNIIFGIVIYF